MKYKVTFVVFLLTVFFCPPLQGQIVPANDYVLSGNANLSYVAKVATQVQDVTLKNIMTNARTNVIVVQAHTVGGQTRYRVLYAIGRATRFRELAINYQDYLRLTELAQSLDRS